MALLPQQLMDWDYRFIHINPLLTMQIFELCTNLNNREIIAGNILKSLHDITRCHSGSYMLTGRPLNILFCGLDDYGDYHCR